MDRTIWCKHLWEAIEKHSASDITSLFALGPKICYDWDKYWAQDCFYTMISYDFCCRLDLSDNSDKDKEFLDFLLRCLVNADEQKALLLRTFEEAIKGHDANSVNYLLELGDKLNCDDKNWLDISSVGECLGLYYNNSEEILRVLMNAMAGVNQQKALLLCTLLGSISCANVSAVIDLLKVGEKLNAGDKNWLQNQLDISSVKIYPSSEWNQYKETLHILMNALTDTGKRHSLLLHLLRSAIFDYKWVEPGHIDYLLKLGIKLSPADKSNGDTLYYWIRRGSPYYMDVTETMLKASADPNWQNPRHKNRTALHEAVIKGSTEAGINQIKLLVRYKADIHKEDNSGLNPIAYGFRNGEKFIQAMYENGLLDFSYHNSKGENYLMLFLKQNLSPETAVQFATLAMKHNLDINDLTNDGKTVLDYLPRSIFDRVEKAYKPVEKFLKAAIKEKKESEREDDLSDFSDIGF